MLSDKPDSGQAPNLRQRVSQINPTGIRTLVIGYAARTMLPVGRVAEIWRFPVKSMGGEKLVESALSAAGIAGDRLWAVRDERAQRIVSGKQVASLMLCQARLLGTPDDPENGAVAPVEITLPNGERARGDDPDLPAKLSRALDRPATLWPLQAATHKDHYRIANGSDPAAVREIFGLGPGEPLPDLSVFPLQMLRELSRYATPRGTYFDAYPMHVLTTSSLAALRQRAPDSDTDVRRFRPNLLIDSGAEAVFAENGWCGGELQVGETLLAVQIPTIRCVMPSRPQPDLPACPSLTRAIATHADRQLGAYATVLRGGRVRVGDPVQLVPAQDSAFGRWMQRRARSLRRLALKAAAKALERG